MANRQSLSRRSHGGTIFCLLEDESKYAPCDARSYIQKGKVKLTVQTRGVIDLGIDDERVTVSDHIAYFWETDEEFSEAVGFLEVGLPGTDHCVVFGHPLANTKVLDDLKAGGFDATHLAEEGRLTVLGGKPSGGDMLAEIGAAFKTAAAAAGTTFSISDRPNPSDQASSPFSTTATATPGMLFADMYFDRAASITRVFRVHGFV
ncbi:MAG: MEDS domain-containing protein [Acidobacteriota bacterium]|nr:MEDS domain-containing protein [Acidobacteriota bacterium]